MGAVTNQSDYKDSLVGLIPKDWSVYTVGEALSIQNNRRKPINRDERKLIPGPYPYYGPTKAQDFISTYEQDGTFTLIGEDGDHFLKYASMSMTQLIHGKSTVNNHAHVLSDTEICSAEWFYHYFRNRDIVNYLTRQGAGRYKLNKAALEKISLAVPPIAERKKITKILSTVDRKLELIDQQITTTQTLKKGLMQKLFSEGVGTQDANGQWQPHTEFKETELGRIPVEWEVEKLSTLHHVFDSLHSTPKFSDDGYPMVRVGDIKDKHIDLNNCKTVSKDVYSVFIKKYQPKISDVVISRVGSFGQCALVVESQPFCLGQNTAVIATEGRGEYLYYFLTSPSCQKQIKHNINGSSQMSLSLKDIRNLKIPVPNDLNESRKISKILSVADMKLDQLSKRKTQTQQLKKGLMQKLLTGQIRVTV
ncbi:restriction endonuclease subunit S [Sansalvadorimonas sp. 2012CJ34-2]|uniref:Restriction endonuclease subunit S n=1 Tax=Parendozoicomonas callyspongiae TaxID=2942213 RepID=A0ABT0PL77_9GAMM|nr:restriction endonuclease subunit S [Sansalvadorimonas sp. 2012CJ34-2]MCL6272142.1 restriction endonuclease subunit S [Sansalvadorimonas sp. 2012CJ34-2]